MRRRTDFLRRRTRQTRDPQRVSGAARAKIGLFTTGRTRCRNACSGAARDLRRGRVFAVGAKPGQRSGRILVVAGRVWRVNCLVAPVQPSFPVLMLGQWFSAAPVSASQGAGAAPAGVARSLGRTLPASRQPNGAAVWLRSPAAVADIDGAGSETRLVGVRPAAWRCASQRAARAAVAAFEGFALGRGAEVSRAAPEAPWVGAAGAPGCGCSQLYTLAASRRSCLLGSSLCRERKV